MSRMVEDMSVLTKADRPGFLRRAAVDLSECVEEIYIKASALAP